MLFIAFTALAFGFSSALAAPFTNRTSICASTPSAEEVAAAEAHFSSNKISAKLGPNAKFVASIPVYWHVIQSGSARSQGNVPDSQISSSIDVLNADYAGTGITFTLAGTDRTTDAESALDWSSTDREANHNPIAVNEVLLTPSTEHNPEPSNRQSPAPNEQVPTPVDTSAPLIRAGGLMTPGQASLFDSLFSLANHPPDPPSTQESPALNLVRETSSGKVGLGGYVRAADRPGRNEDIDDDDPEHLLMGLLSELVLDRKVESNLLPFVVQSFMSWINCFMFESTRAISFARDTIIRGHSLGNETCHKMILVANAALAVS
ncbi:unnamed protein product [Rhizoctonia solani]|uniref:Uncharacterized protein n=1 Tax=Rhizoctonia solani TaxID=456999 RepID=A0A8H3E490_9AGAM|nr:unnamed protein product [Rhizoctonia solani]